MEKVLLFKPKKLDRLPAALHMQFLIFLNRIGSVAIQ